MGHEPPRSFVGDATALPLKAATPVIPVGAVAGHFLPPAPAAKTAINLPPDYGVVSQRPADKGVIASPQCSRHDPAGGWSNGNRYWTAAIHFRARRDGSRMAAHGARAAARTDAADWRADEPGRG